MSKTDKGVLIFNEWFEAMENISDRDCGRLVKAIYKCQILGEEPPEFKGKIAVLANVVFPCIERRVKKSAAGKLAYQTRLNSGAEDSGAAMSTSVRSATPVLTHLLPPKEKKSKEKNSTVKSSELIGRADTIMAVAETSATETSVETDEKRARGRYGNVLLSDKEYEEIKRVIFNADAYIERFSEKMHTKGYRFDSHFDAIMHWWEWDRNLPQYSAPQSFASTPAEREQPRSRTAEDEHWDEFFEAAVARSLGMEEKKQ